MKTIKELEWKTYFSCDCGDYEEGCLRCFQKDVVELIKEKYEELGENTSTARFKEEIIKRIEG